MRTNETVTSLLQSWSSLTHRPIQRARFIRNHLARWPWPSSVRLLGPFATEESLPRPRNMYLFMRVPDALARVLYDQPSLREMK